MALTIIQFTRTRQLVHRRRTRIVEKKELERRTGLPQPDVHIHDKAGEHSDDEDLHDFSLFPLLPGCSIRSLHSHPISRWQAPPRSPPPPSTKEKELGREHQRQRKYLWRAIEQEAQGRVIWPSSRVQGHTRVSLGDFACWFVLTTKRHINRPLPPDNPGYNPYFLDDPILTTGKNKTVITLPSFIVRS